MPLDPDAQKMLDLARAAGRPPIETLTPVEARRMMREIRAALKQEKPELPEVRNFEIEGPHGSIPLRLYRNRPAREAPSQPALVFFHGGGWVFGDLDTHDNLCRHFARAADCTVISVDYRLAPEHKFPTAVDDCVAATRWTGAHAEKLGLDAARLAVAGDSAGGGLATTVALTLAQGGELRLAYQVLIYPVTDFSHTQESYVRLSDGYSLTTAGMRWFREHYLRSDADQKDWRASPLLAPNLAALPPALIVTAGYDPLCDEGQAYARALQHAGVDVIYRHFPGQMHAFIGQSGYIQAADEAIAEIGQALKRAWGTAPD